LLAAKSNHPLYMTDEWPHQRESSLQETLEISFIAKGNSVLHVLPAAGAPFFNK